MDAGSDEDHKIESEGANVELESKAIAEKEREWLMYTGALECLANQFATPCLRGDKYQTDSDIKRRLVWAHVDARDAREESALNEYRRRVSKDGEIEEVEIGNHREDRRLQFQMLSNAGAFDRLKPIEMPALCHDKLALDRVPC